MYFSFFDGAVNVDLVVSCDDLTVKPASELLAPSKNYGDISQIFQSFPTLVKLLFRLLVF